MPAEEEHDAVIIGAGPAGVSSALECHDIQLDTVVLEAADRPGGQLSEIHHSVRNVAAGRFADGRALREALEESAAILGPRLRHGEHVTRVDAAGGFVELADGHGYTAGRSSSPPEVRVKSWPRRRTVRSEGT